MSKTALITGASRGIGFHTVIELLQNSDVESVIAIARETEDFRRAVDQFRLIAEPIGKRVLTYSLDVGDREELRSTIPRIYGDAGNIDLLVNNAGYTNPVPVHQIEFDDFERTMAVNLYAPFTLVQELLHLGNTFKVIVNIASTAGINGRSGWLTYSASKAAVINMSQVLREELSIYGTRVVCISPGRTATALRKVLAPSEDPSTIMQPENVAEVISMLASPLGRFVDSENLVVRQ